MFLNLGSNEIWYSVFFILLQSYNHAQNISLKSLVNYINIYILILYIGARHYRVSLIYIYNFIFTKICIFYVSLILFFFLFFSFEFVFHSGFISLLINCESNWKDWKWFVETATKDQWDCSSLVLIYSKNDVESEFSICPILVALLLEPLYHVTSSCFLRYIIFCLSFFLFLSRYVFVIHIV